MLLQTKAFLFKTRTLILNGVKGLKKTGARELAPGKV
jgi:hypothetical protein